MVNIYWLYDEFYLTLLTILNYTSWTNIHIINSVINWISGIHFSSQPFDVEKKYTLTSSGNLLPLHTQGGGINFAHELFMGKVQ